MIKYRKCFLSRSLVEITIRTEEGLPLSSNPIVLVLMRQVIIRAQQEYPGVRLSHFIIMANHVHFHLVVQDASHVPRFVEYFKRESAHIVNRLLGRRKRTIWGKGYDSPVILDLEKAIERIVYFYLNPETAGLETIDKYPNLSSWKLFDGEKHILRTGVIPRNKVKKIREAGISLQSSKEMALELVRNSKRRCKASIDLDLWMEVYGVMGKAEKKSINKKIRERIKEEETLLRAVRTHSLLGARALQKQSIYKRYRPKKFGKRMLCLATEKLSRVNYIRWYKSRMEDYDIAMSEFHSTGRLLPSLPPGMFMPGGVLLANWVPGLLESLV